MIVEASNDKHFLKSQLGMGSESRCLFGQLERILWTSDSEAVVKTDKLGGVAGGEGKCGDDVEGLLVRERRSFFACCYDTALFLVTPLSVHHYCPHRYTPVNSTVLTGGEVRSSVDNCLAVDYEF